MLGQPRMNLLFQCQLLKILRLVLICKPQNVIQRLPIKDYYLVPHFCCFGVPNCVVNIAIKLLHHMLVCKFDSLFEESPTLSSAELCLHVRVEWDKINVYEPPFRNPLSLRPPFPEFVESDLADKPILPCFWFPGSLYTSNLWFTPFGISSTIP